MSERTVNVALVSRLSLPADRDAVYSLPAPEETALEGAAATELATCLPALREAWLHLLLDGSPDPLIDELSP